MPEWVYSEEQVSIGDPIRLPGLIVAAAEHTRQPIDLNYIAIPKDAWEEILALARRSPSGKERGE